MVIISSTLRNSMLPLFGVSIGHCVVRWQSGEGMLFEPSRSTHLASGRGWLIVDAENLRAARWISGLMVATQDLMMSRLAQLNFHSRKTTLALSMH
jgi:hypothetical protein